MAVKDKQLLPVRDMIFSTDFLPQTWRGIERWLSEHDGDERKSAGLESWAWLYFQLREADDKPEWFPSGKWATLQRIESLLTDAAKARPRL